MIHASLRNSLPYDSLGANFAASFQFLRGTDPAALPLGRTDIAGVDGADAFALVQENALRPPERGRWESHRKYADIQYVVSGVERMGVGPIELFDILTPYNEIKDATFHTAPAGTGSVVTVNAGEFAIFLPEDVHMPLLSPGGGGETVRKIVIKVRV